MIEAPGAKIRKLIFGGPGLVAAATGIGVGDLVTTAVTGARVGLVALGAVVAGVILKYTLNEGVARWQIATGTTFLEGLVTRGGRPFRFTFLAYLAIWTLFAVGALLSACGLAAHAIAPVASVAVWGVVHAVVGTAIVVSRKFPLFENLMRACVGAMVLLFVGCALFVNPAAEPARVAVEIHGANFRLLLALLGGVGGSVTLLSYGYWLREHRWSEPQTLGAIRADLFVTYFVTAIVGGCSVVIAAKTGLDTRNFHGADLGIELARQLANFLGPTGYYAYAVGFWAAAVSSLLGTLQSIPYLYLDLLRGPDRRPRPGRPGVRGLAATIGTVPMVLLFVNEPLGIILLFACLASLFIPFLATALIYFNSQSRWVGDGFRSSAGTNATLVLSLGLFGYLFVRAFLEWCKTFA